MGLIHQWFIRQCVYSIDYIFPKVDAWAAKHIGLIGSW